jgi:spore coat protein U-like protein
MKNLMKSLFIVALFFAGFATEVFGQTSQISENTIEASATVYNNIVVTPGDNLNFGQLVKGEEKIVDITGSLLGDNDAMISRVVVGTFIVSAGTGSDVQLELTLPDELSSGDNKLPISFVDGENSDTYLVGYKIDSSSENATGATRFDPASSVQVKVNNVVSFPSTGIKVFVGGKVVPGNDQPAGVYTDTIKLTASYN